MPPNIWLELKICNVKLLFTLVILLLIYKHLWRLNADSLFLSLLYRQRKCSRQQEKSVLVSKLKCLYFYLTQLYLNAKRWAVYVTCFKLITDETVCNIRLFLFCVFSFTIRSTITTRTFPSSIVSKVGTTPT